MFFVDNKKLGDDGIYFKGWESIVRLDDYCICVCSLHQDDQKINKQKMVQNEHIILHLLISIPNSKTNYLLC